MVTSVAVYCGSSIGKEEVYGEQAFALGKKLAEEQITLIYGGAKVGLMGKVSSGAVKNHGQVIGVIPHFLKNKELASDNLTNLITVETMHERKSKMNDLADGIIAMPGGFGTMEELFEILTWAQLGLHQKPVALFNIGGFYDGLIQFLDTMVLHGFLRIEHRNSLIIANTIEELIREIKAYQNINLDKWIVPENKM